MHEAWLPVREQETVASAVSGSDEAWHEIVEQYSGLIYSIVCRYLTHPDEDERRDSVGVAGGEPEGDAGAGRVGDHDAVGRDGGRERVGVAVDVIGGRTGFGGATETEQVDSRGLVAVPEGLDDRFPVAG